jgi:hypothetical protein
MKARKIELHIEELVLHGFEPGNHHAIGEAVESELERLLTEGGLAENLTSGGEVPLIHADKINLASGESPVRLGHHIAKSVYRGIGR